MPSVSFVTLTPALFNQGKKSPYICVVSSLELLPEHTTSVPLFTCTWLKPPLRVVSLDVFMPSSCCRLNVVTGFLITTSEAPSSRCPEYTRWRKKSRNAANDWKVPSPLNPPQTCANKCWALAIYSRQYLVEYPLCVI